MTKVCLKPIFAQLVSVTITDLSNDPMVSWFSMAKLNQDMYCYRLVVRRLNWTTHRTYTHMMGFDACFEAYRFDISKPEKQALDISFDCYLKNLNIGE